VGVAPANIGSTYQERLRQYERRERMILWVGAGLVGLIGLVTTNLSAGAPKALSAATVSLIILGGGALATARIRFEWQATLLRRAIEDGTDPGKRLMCTLQPWPNFAEIAWMIGLVCVPVAGLVYAAAVWWAIA
jgi:hypothetical protein